MCSPASSKILYRNPRFLHLAFLQLHHQQQSGVFCDVLLQAEGEAVQAHCCVLSACSPFFTERLEQERPVPGRKVVLELGGLKIRTLRKLVDFLYTSEMEVSREEVQDVLSAARQLRVCELESLQLEGGRLVKAPPGRRLNRECLQPSAVPPSTSVLAPGHHPRTPLPAPQLPCPPRAAGSVHLGQEEGAPEEGTQPSAERIPSTLLLPGKPRACRAPQGESLAGRGQEPGADKPDPGLGPAAPAPPSLSPSGDQQLLPRKIRLSRSKPPPSGGTTRAPGTSSGPSAAPAVPGRRLWRRRINRDAAEDKQKPCRASPLQGTPSPSGPGRPGGSKKRSPEAAAPGPDSTEEGQVGRVKLRKVVNGTCWEVVQEPPPALSNPTESTQAPAPGDMQESPVGEQVSSARIELYQDSPEGTGALDIMLTAGHSPDQPGVGRAFGSSPQLLGKEPMLSGDHSEPCAFGSALRGQHCDGVSSSMATSELEDILNLVLCGSDIGPPVRSPESPGAEGCRTPSYHLTGAGGNWMEAEEWCLPDLELWSRELEGLEKEPAGENREPRPLGALPAPSAVGADEALPVSSTWTSDLELAIAQPPDGHPSSPGCPSTPGSSWTERGLATCLAVHELCPTPGPGTNSSEDEEIDVVHWTGARLLPAGAPSVWPDPSSESETEVDVLT
ncbi:PREDICTED: BTB/POZ domain-containing protein 18 [Chinchilla lanigera]|uniref:BTB domain containing 18 n=1 Tax=Chinchilla lanigera TaxID=34839 RepID=A0A8C2YLY8_CHILA|nr:PREDICTED: BTB/POZ domain-containing protein 18 [Chinchilla lanigera]